MLDLSTAFAQRLNFGTASVGIQAGKWTGSTARFYRATVGAGDRATLTWNRRTIGCVGVGCQADGLPLTNLQLEQLDGAGATVAASESNVDNVEQVRSPSGGDVLYRVRSASDVVGSPAEPFALAAKTPLTPLVSPQPELTLQTSQPTASPGDLVTLTAELVNPSPDLTGLGTSVTLDLPAGAELVSGNQTQDLGTLETNGNSGDTAGASWSVRVSDPGVREFAARAESTRYGESFRSQASATLTVQAPPSPPPPGAPPPPPPAATAPPPAATPPPSARASARLRIRSARLGRRSLAVAGTLDPTCRGTVTLVYSTRVRGRVVRVRRRVSAAAGGFRGSVRVPRGASRRGILSVRYGGDAGHLPASLRRRVK